MSFINNLIDKVADLIKVKLEKAKLDIQGKLADILSRLVSFLIIYLFASITILFLAMSLAFFLNSILDSSFLGFLIVALIFLVVTVLVYLVARSGIFAKAFEEAILKEQENVIAEDEAL